MHVYYIIFDCWHLFVMCSVFIGGEIAMEGNVSSTLLPKGRPTLAPPPQKSGAIRVVPIYSIVFY